MNFSPYPHRGARLLARTPTRFELPAVNDSHHGPHRDTAASGSRAVLARPEPRSDQQRVLRGVVRAAALWCLIAVAPMLLLLDIQWLGNAVGERSLVETTQLVLLAVTATAFVTLARRNRADRRFAVLAAGFFLCMGIRETDAAWDLVADGLWQALVAVVALAAAAYAAADWRAALRSLGRFLGSRAGLLMTLALGILLVYSRLLGMGVIWEGLLDDQYLRVFKNAVEETTELLGYVLIAASGVMYVAGQRVRQRRAMRTAATAPV